MPVGMTTVALMQLACGRFDRDRKSLERRVETAIDNRSHEESLIVDLVGEYLAERNRSGIRVARIENLEHEARLGDRGDHFALAVGLAAGRQVTSEHERDLGFDLHRGSVRDD